MDATPTNAPIKYYRWLPYWAVLQTDLRQTTQNWVWRVWVLASIAAATLYLTHRFAVYREAKFVLTVDKVVANLLSWTALGTVTLVVAFCSGAIATERGTLADSILCRGISRYQYFLAKLHSRLITVIGTYLVLTGGVITVAAFAFPGLVTPTGCAAALAGLGCLLAAVVCFGVTTSALCGSTVLSVSLLWIGLYTLGFALTFLPDSYLTPDRMIDAVPKMLQGLFNREELYRTIGYAVLAGAASTVIGLVGFARTDV
jgi:hypothetical protein